MRHYIIIIIIIKSTSAGAKVGKMSNVNQWLSCSVSQ